MVEVLDKPSTRALVAKISVPGYHWAFEQGIIPDNTELIKGIIINKISKSPEHSFAIRFLFELMNQIFHTDFYVTREDPITLEDSEPEPDVSVIYGDSAAFKKGHPTTARLIIEVSKTSYDLDFDKQFIYAEANIPEYWLVNLEKAETEVYRRPEAGRYLEKNIYAKGSAIPLEGGLILLDEVY